MKDYLRAFALCASPLLLSGCMSIPPAQEQQDSPLPPPSRAHISGPVFLEFFSAAEGHSAIPVPKHEQNIGVFVDRRTWQTFRLTCDQVVTAESMGIILQSHSAARDYTPQIAEFAKARVRMSCPDYEMI